MIIGIDPGLDGAIAVLNDNDDVVDIFDMPTLQDNSKRVINCPLLHYAIKTHVDNSAENSEAVTVVLERLQPIKNSGVVGAFALGRTYQSCIAIASCLGLRIEYVDSRTWKKHYGLKGGKDQKKHSITKVTQLYPSECHYFTRVKDSDRAEALLIARYGRLKIIGESSQEAA